MLFICEYSLKENPRESPLANDWARYSSMKFFCSSVKSFGYAKVMTSALFSISSSQVNQRLNWSSVISLKIRLDTPEGEPGNPLKTKSSGNISNIVFL